MKYIKFVPYIIIIGLVIALSVTQCSKQKVKLDNHEAELKQAINNEKARVIDLQNREQNLKHQIKQDSIKSRIVVIALKSENRALKAEVKKALTPHVVQVINDNPDLDKFVDLKDSLIRNLDRTIDTLHLQKDSQWSSFNKLLSVSEEKFEASQQINTHYVELNQQLSKQVRKERNKKTGLKIVSGVLATGILYMAIKE